MKFSFFCRIEDDEHSGGDCVEMYVVFATNDEFFFGKIVFDRGYFCHW